jgi:purine-cytosine permease-like protein
MQKDATSDNPRGGYLMSSQHLPAPDALWKVEQNGINPVDLSSRHGSSRDLFWLWFAGNLSFTYIVIGAVVWSYKLSLAQSLSALAVGLVSFVAIGYLGISGQATGLPMMAYSARYFGRRGNRLLALIAWINQVGWETVVLIITSYAIATLFHLMFGVHTTALWLVISLALAALAELSLATLGHATIEYLQTWISYIFGFLTLLVLLALLPHVAWHAVWLRPPGPWMTGFVPAITIVIAVSALSWATTASDYTRYLPHSVSRRHIVNAATWGSIIPTALLMVFGLLLAQNAPSLATASNPVEFLLHWLPAWAQIPYILITIGGLIAGGMLCAYSSGLCLLAAGVKTRRSRTIGIDAALSLSASLYVLLVAQGFLNNFEGFLSLVAALLAPWVPIALLNIHKSGRAPAHAAVLSWITGAALAVATTSTPIFTGPMAHGIFSGSSLGYLAGAFVTGIMYFLWIHLQPRLPRSRQQPL